MKEGEENGGKVQREGTGDGEGGNGVSEGGRPQDMHRIMPCTRNWPKNKIRGPLQGGGSQ